MGACTIFLNPKGRLLLFLIPHPFKANGGQNERYRTYMDQLNPYGHDSS